MADEHAHKFVFLWRDVIEEDRLRSHFDVFFCEHFLQYRKILTTEWWYNGEGRWIEHPKLEYA